MTTVADIANARATIRTPARCRMIPVNTEEAMNLESNGCCSRRGSRWRRVRCRSGGHAQSYPSQDIRLICAFPAGSGADVLVRYLRARSCVRSPTAR